MTNLDKNECEHSYNILQKDFDKVVEMLASGVDNYSYIAKETGVSRPTVIKIGSDKAVSKHIQSLASDRLKNATDLASKTLLQLLSGSVSDHVRFQVARAILDYGGLKPEENLKVEGSINNPFAGLTTEELRKIIERKT